MKKAMWLVLALVALVAAQAWARGAGEDELTGIWYGGSDNPDHAGFKYEYRFVPVATDRWEIEAYGAYNADSLGAAVKTPWIGEVNRVDGVYEMRLIALTTTDPVHPPEELPTIQAVRAHITMNGEDSATIIYDLYALYDWGQRPFAEDPVNWVLAPGAGEITETIHRMDMSVAFH